MQYHTILHGVGVIARALGLRGILATMMCFNSNGDLLGTLCGKRQDAGMDNKHFITPVSMHIASYCTCANSCDNHNCSHKNELDR